MQKAFAWLQEHNIPYAFHDYKKEGAQYTDLIRWAEKASWEKLLNKSGLTWKKQRPEIQKSIVNQDEALHFMQANPSSIKRPIIEGNDIVLIGFNPEELKIALVR